MLQADAMNRRIGGLESKPTDCLYLCVGVYCAALRAPNLFHRCRVAFLVVPTAEIQVRQMIPSHSHAPARDTATDCHELLLLPLSKVLNPLLILILLPLFDKIIWPSTLR